MSGAAFFGVKKLKGSGIITVAARHNKREIQAALGAAGSINPARTRLNYALAGPAGADDVGRIAKERMTAAGVGKLRKDAVLALEFVFSLPANTAIDDHAYFTACTEWAGATFGGVTLSAEVHLDEGAPHCHVLLLPLVDGRMDGSNLIGGKQNLARLHKDFHTAVASKFGLRKAPGRLSGAAKQTGAKAVLQKLRTTGDSALRSRVWAAIRDAVERDPAPFLLTLGIELSAPKKQISTMAQIFTSKGKGPAKESPNPIGKGPSNPIGFVVPEKERTLCSVGFAPKLALPAQQPRRTADPASERLTVPIRGLAQSRSDPKLETKRIRDSDLDPQRYDPRSNEYVLKKPPVLRQRDDANAWCGALVARQIQRKDQSGRTAMTTNTKRTCATCVAFDPSATGDNPTCGNWVNVVSHHVDQQGQCIVFYEQPYGAFGCPHHQTHDEEASEDAAVARFWQRLGLPR